MVLISDDYLSLVRHSLDLSPCLVLPVDVLHQQLKPLLYVEICLGAHLHKPNPLLGGHGLALLLCNLPFVGEVALGRQ